MRQALTWTIGDPVNLLIYVSQAVNVLNDRRKDINTNMGLLDTHQWNEMQMPFYVSKSVVCTFCENE